MTEKKQLLLSAPAGAGETPEEKKILNEAKKIIHSKIPESEAAPHGRDAKGEPIAPYGFKQNGLPKKLSGRNWDKDKHRDKPKDEAELLKEIEGEFDVTEYEKEPEASEETKPPVNDEKLPPVDGTKPPASEQQPPPTPDKPKPQPGKHKVYISGAMFLFILDLVVPKTISFVYGTFLGVEFTNPKQLKMDAEEKKELAPLCDEVVAELLASLSPLQQFMLYTGIMYVSKAEFADTRRKVKNTKKKV